MNPSRRLLQIGNTKLLMILIATVALAGLLAWAVIGKRPPWHSVSADKSALAIAGQLSESTPKKARILLPAEAVPPVKAAPPGKDPNFKFPLSTIAVLSNQPPALETARKLEEFARTVAPGEMAEGEHGGREDWFYAQRAYPRPAIPFGAMVNANEELVREETALRLRALNSSELNLAAAWTALGPAPIAVGQTFGSPRVPVSGRVNVLALDPGYNGGANQTVYAGAAVGGVWRSTNNGQNWTPLMDDQPFLAIGALAIDPTNSNVIYAGTGEGKVTQGYYGVGLLKSTDGGATWNLITGPISTRPPNQPAFINASFTKIVVDPVTPSIVFATTTIGVPNSASSAVFENPPLGQRGVWRSADGGQTWTNVDPPGTGGNFSASDVVVDPFNHNRVFAVMRGVGVYRSTNGGAAGSWTKLAGGLPAETLWFRGNLAVGPAIAPSTDATIYAAFASPASDLQGIYRTTDGGNNWTALVRPQVPGQSNYNLGLTVDPVDASVVYYGTSANSNNNGGTLWRSTNGGQTWSDLSRGSGTGGLHADTHFIIASPANRNIVFTGNDGGVFRTENATSANVTWTSLNQTLSITQFQSLALHPTNPNLLLGGTQDNGTVRYNGNPSWFHSQDGDGGAALIDQSNPLVMYHTFFNRNGSSAIMGAEISFNGGDSWADFVGCLSCTGAAGEMNPNDRVSFYAPMALHTGFTGANGNVVYFGTHRLYRSANRGQSWFGVGGSVDGFGTDLTKNQPNTQSYLTAISAHPALNQNTNPPGEVVWVGTSDGNVQVTANAGNLAGATWANVTKAPLPNRYVTDIALDPNNQQRAMVMFSGFNANTTASPGHVFLTTNGGASWTDISGNLPDTPANSGVIDPAQPNTYYIGTDIGVFQTTNGGATWIRMADGMPKVPVLMLRYHATSQSLVAATHGRGMYRVQVSGGNPGQTTEELKTDDGTAETGTVGNGLIIVNRLTPSAYPSTLQKIRIFTGQFQNQPNPSGQLIRLIALNSATAPPSGSPLLLDQTVAIPTVQSAGFVEFMINNGPTITSGDWYIGFQAPNPANGVGFFADTNGAQQQRGYFSTDNGGTYQGPLVFTGTPQVPVNILIRAVVQNGGQASAPTIDVTPASLDFGSVNVNATADRTLTVRNTGTAALNVTGITSNNARFTVTLATSFTVAPGGQQTVTVRFAPTAAGSQTGTLTLASNDSARPSVAVPLSGTGATQSDLVTLTSGVAYNDTLPAPPAPNVGVVNLVQYTIAVPSGATQLKIELNGNQDVDLFVRFGARVVFQSTGPIADFVADSLSGVETITITPGSSPPLQAGDYLIAVANYGPGAVSYSVKATVTGGAQCGYSISPTSQSFDAGGGQGSVSVTTANGCAWTAASNAAFITINSGASGNGSGTVNFTVAANTGAQRGGTMTIAGQTFTVTQAAISYEADVAPRPNGNGNGAVTVIDWIQVGRFTAGLDQVNAGSEFQRADCAPKETKGSGSLTMIDWVQAGRYAAGLDPVVTAGGPTAATQLRIADFGMRNTETAIRNHAVRTLKAINAHIEPGERGTVSLELDAQGNENALGFSLDFDPAQLQFVSAALGSGATGATLNVNSAQGAKGRLGVAIALPAGQQFAAGLRQLLVLTFTAAPSGNGANSAISFGDSPIAREVSDPAANALPAVFTSDAVTLARSVATVSAASFSGETLAQEAIVAAFGGNLATTVEIASTLPLPTQLAGTTVKVTDSLGVERLAPLFFVAPSQVNYQIPPGTAAGVATVTITSGDGSISTGTATIASVAPGLFAANASGQGFAAAVVLRVKADGSLIYEPVARHDGSKFVAVPIDLGPETDQVFLLLFGTGWRYRSSLSAVTVTLGGVNAEVLYAGDPGEFAGQDQINLRIPRRLAGRGKIDVALTVDGHPANVVRISIK